jgi:hypothetical protein
LALATLSPVLMQSGLVPYYMLRRPIPRRATKSKPYEALVKAIALLHQQDVGSTASTRKSCNTPLKSNHSPVAGKHGPTDADAPEKLAGEEAFLIYPTGDIDSDPEDLITFHGIVAVPKVKSGPKKTAAPE